MHPELHTEIEIDAASDAVWEVLVDLDRYPDRNPCIVSSQGRADVGEKLTNRLQPPDGRAAIFTPTVTVVEPSTACAWLGRFGRPRIFDGRHRVDLAPRRTGGPS